MRACASHQTMLDFLENRLPAAEDRCLAEHLGQCRRCHALACELSDDSELRRSFRSSLACGEPLESAPLRERLYRLGSPSAPSALARAADTPASAGNRNRAATFPAGATPPDGSRPAAADEPDPQAVGRFTLQRRLGAGGFGVVFLAYDPLLKRQVALKLPRAPAIVDPDRRERFLREARSAAGLQHPHIVPIYEAGEIGPLCYITAAYCPGPTLAEWMRQQSAPATGQVAAQIILHLAEAVAYAHAHGVLHRDIKPENVLLDPSMTAGGLPFTARLTDFGMAKLMDGTADETASGVLLGTPRYMAPEQAAGRRDQLGPPTDVYALGVLLYELLTGRPPFQGDDSADTLRRVVGEDPFGPRRWNPRIPRDLEAICLKCLEKPPGRRYATAVALADDLRRFLCREPTQARPMAWHERGGRWTRRHPARAGLIFTAAAAVFLLIGGLTFHNRRLNDVNVKLDNALHVSQSARRRAEQSERETRQVLYATDMRLAARARDEGDLRQMMELLTRHQPAPGQPDPRGFEWHYLWRQGQVSHATLARHAGGVYFVRYSPDGHTIATAGKEAIVRLFDAATGAERAALVTGQVEVNSVGFTPDGKNLASAGDDGTLRVWDLADRREVLRIAAHSGPAYGVVFTSDGQRLISCGDEPMIRIWDSITGEPRGEWKGHTHVVEAVALSPDGRMLGSASRDRTAKLWDIASGKDLQTLRGHGGNVNAIAFSPDGKLAATVSFDSTARVWDVATAQELATSERLDNVDTVAFSPDGHWLATGDRGGMICLSHPLSTLTSASVAPGGARFSEAWHAHTDHIWCLTFSPDGKRLASAGRDGNVHLWNPRRRFESAEAAPPARIEDFTWISGLAMFAAVTEDALDLRDSASGAVIAHLAGPEEAWHAVAASHDGARLAAGGAGGTIVLLDPVSRARRATWNLGGNLSVLQLLFSPDGATLAALCGTKGKALSRQVRLFSLPGGDLQATLPAPDSNTAAFSPDGAWFAADSYNSVVVWDLPRRVKLHTLHGHTGTVWSLAFIPGSSLLASASGDRRIKLWNVMSGRDEMTLTGHRGPVNSVSASPDGRSLAACGDDGLVTLWHVATGRQLLELERQSNPIDKVAFSPDGRRLACLSHRSGVLVFDAAPAE